MPSRNSSPFPLPLSQPRPLSRTNTLGGQSSMLNPSPSSSARQPQPLGGPSLLQANQESMDLRMVSPQMLSMLRQELNLGDREPHHMTPAERVRRSYRASLTDFSSNGCSWHTAKEEARQIFLDPRQDHYRKTCAKSGATWYAYVRPKSTHDDERTTPDGADHRWGSSGRTATYRYAREHGFWSTSAEWASTGRVFVPARAFKPTWFDGSAGAGAGGKALNQPMLF